MVTEKLLGTESPEADPYLVESFMAEPTLSKSLDFLSERGFAECVRRGDSSSSWRLTSHGQRSLRILNTLCNYRWLATANEDKPIEELHMAELVCRLETAVEVRSEGQAAEDLPIQCWR